MPELPELLSVELLELLELVELAELLSEELSVELLVLLSEDCSLLDELTSLDELLELLVEVPPAHDSVTSCFTQPPDIRRTAAVITEIVIFLIFFIIPSIFLKDVT